MKSHSVSSIPKFCWFLLMLLGVIWGSSFYGVARALDSFQPMQIASARILIGAFVLTAWCIVLGEGLPSLTDEKRKIWFYSFGMGVFTNVIPFSLLSWAQTSVSSSFAGVTMSMIPLVMLPLAHIFVNNEKLTLKKILGLSIGFLGILILFDFPKIFKEFDFVDNFEAKVACFLAVLCYAVGSIITRRSPEVSRLSFAASGLLIATIIILPLTMFLEGFPKTGNLSSIIGILYLGILPTGLATVVLVYIIKTAGPSFLSLVNYLVPIWAIVFGVLLNSEELKSSFVIALFFIFIGMTISQMRLTPLHKYKLMFLK